jgi:hypothetical protein
MIIKTISNDYIHFIKLLTEHSQKVILCYTKNYTIVFLVFYLTIYNCILL